MLLWFRLKPGGVEPERRSASICRPCLVSDIGKETAVARLTLSAITRGLFLGRFGMMCACSKSAERSALLMKRYCSSRMACWYLSGIVSSHLKFVKSGWTRQATASARAAVSAVSEQAVDEVEDNESATVP